MTRKRKCEPRSKNAPPVIPVAGPGAFLQVDAITRAAEAAGWPSQKAFMCAMQLVAHGTTVEEAKRMFEFCERVRQ